mgnify:CR=1 FL=1
MKLNLYPSLCLSLISNSVKEQCSINNLNIESYKDIPNKSPIKIFKKAPCETIRIASLGLLYSFINFLKKPSSFSDFL